MPLNLNVSPYFDDFDESKDFVKTLYRPTVALQARELIQSQTVIQKQIERFGKFNFQNGSAVTGGQVAVKVDVGYVKVTTANAITDFVEGLTLTGGTSGAVAKVILAIDVTAADPVTLMVQYITGNTATTAPVFTDGEVISDGGSVSATVATNGTGIGSLAFVDEGSYFVNGIFTNINKQVIALEKYSSTPTYRVGLDISESIVTSLEDTTLNDPASGSPNFNAPGAHRLKITLNLVKKTLASTDDTDFIELMKIENGVLQKHIKYPVLSDLENTLARRTFDESGNYTVRPFRYNLKAHSTDDTKLSFELEPGKAFVGGIEFETIANTAIDLDRARDFQAVDDYSLQMTYGNYVIVDTLEGTFDISTHELVQLHDVVKASAGAGSVIGTARIRQVKYHQSGQYRLYLYDIRMNTTKSIELVLSVVNDHTLGAGAKAAGDINAANGQSAGKTLLLSSSFNEMIFKVSDSFIKTMAPLDNLVQIQRRFSAVSFTAGIASIAVGAGEVLLGTVSSDADADTKNNHYQVSIVTVGTSGFSAGQVIDLTAASRTVILQPGSQSTSINLQDAGNFTADVVATTNINDKNQKVKTINLNTKVAVTTPNTTIGSLDSTLLSDVNKLKAVYNSSSVPTITFDASPVPGVFIIGETVTTPSGGVGTVISQPTGTTLEIVYGSGTFVDAEVVTGADSLATGTIATSGFVNQTDITSQYELDNGQRDNFYDHGTIELLNTDVAVPGANIVIVVDYFTHTGIGYFSVDSYTTNYDTIPSYTSPITGKVFELRDSLDFRPRRQDNVTTSPGFVLEGIETPRPNSNFLLDYNFYLPRIDKIMLDKDKEFTVVKGVSAVVPEAPTDISGAMTLYVINYPPYVMKPSNVVVQYIENKRYTMRDIGKLEKRIDNVEYYTSLTLLEKDTADLSITDAAGSELFKNGILVDPFRGHSVGDVLNLDYKVSVDFQKQQARPPFISRINDLNFDSTASTGVTKTGDLISLAYTTENFISQLFASRSINVNPFNVISWVGAMELDPPSDNWMDRTNAPDVLVNTQGENDAWESFVGTTFQTQWNDWNTNWSSEQVLSSTNIFEHRAFISRGTGELRGGRAWPGGDFGHLGTTRQTVAVNQRQSRTGIRTTITGTEAITKELGNRIVDVSIVPFMRARTITINAKGMKPSTQVYPFFDGVNVQAYCTPSGGSLGDNVFTDVNGSVLGLTFAIPNSDTQRFRTGERMFRLIDDSSENLEASSTYSESIYRAEGLSAVQENTIISTRVPIVSRQQLTSNRTTRSVVNRDSTFIWGDPLAQTFLVDSALYPNGIFLTDVNLYFKTKTSTGIPVRVEIRETLNGFPNQKTVPFSQVALNPGSINVSADASAATKFTFPSLVYLPPGEFALVVISQSDDYEVYISEIGQNILGTNRKISEQPYAGSLFKSQNASTWSPDQNQDLMFVFNKALFSTTGTREAFFNNTAETPDVKMDLAQLMVQELIVNNTLLNWEIRSTDVALSSLSALSSVISNENIPFDTQQKITNAVGAVSGGFVSKATFVSNSADISPIIDTTRNSVILVENLINNDSTNETDASGGNALAKYITRIVTLSEGFDADRLKVFITANRPPGASIEVYYKILSSDASTSFHDENYVLMSEVVNDSSSASNSPDDFRELEFAPVTEPFTTTFKYFAIKVVFKSTNTSKVPIIKDLRAIALV